MRRRVPTPRREEVLLVVSRSGPEFLVLLRSPERHGYWNLVAGGVEEGEAPTDAALRELHEETGLARPTHVESLPLALRYRRPGGFSVTLHPFWIEAPGGWEPTLDEEHVEYRWCSEDEAVRLLAYPEPREAVRAVATRLETRA
jgi:8-oxo-dGTP pyrophosphatase MutT (NUDIX family)